MKTKTIQIDSKSLTKNNIEKIKKSIDCLKETIKRSNSHLYINNDYQSKTLHNDKINEKNNSNFFLNSHRYSDNPYKIKTKTNLNENKIISSPKKLNNISFYNINITNNNNNKKIPETTRSLYSCDTTFRNKFDNKSNSCIIRYNSERQNNSLKNIKNNTSKIDKEKMKNSINKIETINKAINTKYKTIVQEFKSSFNQNELIKNKNSETIKKTQMIKIINANIQKRIDKIQIKEANTDYEKERKNILEKNKELNIQIEQKNKLIINIKNQINEIINGGNKISCLNELNNKNKEIEQLKNKINQFYHDISEQEKVLNKIKI